MSAILLDGNAFLDHVKQELRERVKALGERGVAPGLGTILVGDDPNSAAYIRGKRADSADVGIESFHLELPPTATQAEVLAAIADFNENPAVDAFIVQLPLPAGLDDQAALEAIDPAKDADGLHPVNLGRLMIGARGPRPCTPLGIQALLVHHEVPIERRHVVIVGRGLTIGRPLAVLLSLKESNANATITHCHTGTADLGGYTRTADILIAAAGAPEIITPDMVKPGAAVVGAGITMDGRRIVPDVSESCADVAGWITPRIGGVGPTTRAMLLRNTVVAAERAAGVESTP
jgi:methylenetetrahydrofolate dehydrogenase (NADP+) / methenyltetrahydrofolate cyclohydrolase